MAYRFFSHPAHFKGTGTFSFTENDWLEASHSTQVEVIQLALSGTEFRSTPALSHLKMLLATRADYSISKPGFGKAAMVASPPSDLPALLRLANTLDDKTQTDTGEKALTWQCECGTRYAVPLSLVRSVAIVCERCKKPVNLMPGSSLGEDALLDPLQGAVNHCRKQLASFFREAMARGWPVWVCTYTDEAR